MSYQFCQLSRRDVWIVDQPKQVLHVLDLAILATVTRIVKQILDLRLEPELLARFGHIGSGLLDHLFHLGETVFAVFPSVGQV